MAKGRPRTRANTVQARKARQYAKDWYEANKERVKQLGKTRRVQNRARVAMLDRARRLRLRLEVIQILGGHCACCGETRWEFLAIDHIHNDGAAERATGCGGTRLVQIVKALKNPKKRYRLLCHNCNQSLDFYGYCPHIKSKLPLRRGAAGSKLHMQTYKEVLEVLNQRQFIRLARKDKEAIRRALASGESVSSQSRKYKVSRNRIVAIRDGTCAPF